MRPSHSSGITTLNASGEKLIIFLRHGETSYSCASLTAGATDVGLTELGRREAMEAGSFLASFDGVPAFISPMRRTLETAEIALPASCQKVILPELRERGWGNLEGLPKSMREVVPLPANAEPPQSFAKRASLGLQYILSGEPTAIVVSHSGIYRAFYQKLLQANTSESLPTGTVRCFIFTSGKWAVLKSLPVKYLSDAPQQ